MMYCLTHDIWLPDYLNGYVDCFLVTSLPPELPDNWIDFVVEPSPEEMERINLNARELELSL